jgi:hypothetical protein
MVYKLPLRQAEGFINSIFESLHLPLKCPDYATLSKRLSQLNISTPKYLKTDKPDSSIESIS